MDIRDYNARLADSRQEYKSRYDDATQKLKKSHEREIENLKEAHEARESSQRDNYLEAREREEARAQERFDLQNKRVSEEVDRRQREFVDRARAKQREHEGQMREVKRGFARRMENISDAFRKAQEERERFDRASREGLERKFEKSLSENRNNYEKDVSNIREGLRREIASYRNKLADEKRAQLGRERAEKQRLIRESCRAEKESKKFHRLNTEALKKSHAQELAQKENHYQNLLKSRDLMVQEQIDDYRKNFSDTIRKREQNLVDKMGQEQRRHAQQERLMYQGFDDALAKDEAANKRVIQGKEGELRRYGTTVLAPLKKESQERIDYFRQELDRKNREMETSAMEHKNDMANKLQALRIAYGRDMKATEERRRQAFSDLREIQRKEMSSQVEESRKQQERDRRDIVQGLQRGFEAKLLALEEKYARILAEKEAMENIYAERMKNLVKYFQGNILDMQRMEQEKQAEDRQDFRDSFLRQQKEFEARIKGIRKEMASRMQRARFEHDRKVTSLTRNYEGRLGEERRALEREMKTRLSDAERKLVDLQERNRENINMMKESYEGKLVQVRENRDRDNLARWGRDSGGKWG